MKKELEKAIKECAVAACETTDSVKALQFTQAALNAAHALVTLEVNKIKD